MSTIKISYTFLLILVSLALFSQEDKYEDYSFRKLKKLAISAERFGDTYLTIDYRQAMASKKDMNAKDVYKLAELHKKTRNYLAASAYYSSAYTLNPKKYTIAKFHHALMQKNLGNKSQAIELLNEFKKEYRGQKNDKYYNRRVKRELEGFDLPHNSDSVLVRINRLDDNINTPHMELSPIFINDSTIMFTAIKLNDDTVIDVKDTSKHYPYMQIFESVKFKNKWIDAGKHYIPVINENYHISSIAFSNNGNQFYFSKCKRDWKGEIKCALYKSEKKDDLWQLPQRLPNAINAPGFTTTMPVFGKESKKGRDVLYFVSDRPGGKGKMDIWASIYNPKKQAFDPPKNAGSKINTTENELTPFIDTTNGTLYFASNGHPGYGGLDIFSSKGEINKWIKSENIGPEINSSVDELNLKMRNEISGIFTSNQVNLNSIRHKYCCDDIYEFKWLIKPSILIEGIAFDKKKGEENPLGKTRIDVFITDSESGDEVMVRSFKSDENGYYAFHVDPKTEYTLKAHGLGYFTAKKHFNTFHSDKRDTLSENIGLDKMTADEIVIPNIYYPFDKSHLTNEARATIDTTIYEILMDNPDIIVEISSHTDSKGHDEYNDKLSQARAESVVKYLTKLGVEKERLEAKGYGEHKPIAHNIHEDGSDNPEGRAKNRRTAFRIIGGAGLDINYQEGVVPKF